MLLHPLEDVLAELDIEVPADESELDHVVCECNIELALCGADVSADGYDDSPWSSEDPPPNMCVVCLDLSEPGAFTCARCRA